MAWTHTFIAPAQNRVLAKLVQKYPNHFNPATLDNPSTLEASVQAAFAKPVIAWSRRSLILELGIARHCQQLTDETPKARFTDFVA